jgi:hypothetical protein
MQDGGDTQLLSGLEDHGLVPAAVDNGAVDR